MTSWWFNFFLSVGRVVEEKNRDKVLGEADWNEQCCKPTGSRLVCLTALRTGSWIHCIHAHVVLTPSECIQLNKELHRHSPFPPSISLSFPLRLVFSWSLRHSHKQRMRERERNKALVLQALTQHLCLSWFQMNKAEYQVAHLYGTQRQIDQSITAGCCWITNAL